MLRSVGSAAVGVLRPQLCSLCHTTAVNNNIYNGEWQDSPIDATSHVSDSIALSKKLPNKVKIVICGGGTMGTALLYQFAQMGLAADTLLIDAGKLGTGTTWQGSGFLGAIKLQRSEMEIMRSSQNTVRELEKQGHDTGWKECGSIYVARTRDRLTHLRKSKAISEARGIECHMLTPAEISRKCDILNTEDLKGALWVPKDGVCDPYKLNYTLLKLAREQGAHVAEECRFNRTIVMDRQVVAVETNKGTVECDYFINAGGLWARKIGQMSEPHVKIPIHPAENHFLYTRPVEGLDPMIPAIRDPDGNIFIREYNGGFLAGGFEKWAKPSFEKGDLPEGTFEREAQEDWDHFHVMLREMLHRAPIMKSAILGQLLQSSDGFSCDGKWVLGQSSEFNNYYVAAGGKSGESAAAIGIGDKLSKLILEEAPIDDFEIDILRFLPGHNNRKFLRDRVKEVPGRHYGITYPFLDFETGRCLRMSPIFNKMKSAGAVFGQVMGYERPSFFMHHSSESYEDEESAPFIRAKTSTWTKPEWFDICGKEYRACREGVAILDYSSFTKVDIWSKGEEVVSALQYLCSNNVDIPIGGIVNTGMQNKFGGYENDCSLARIAHNHFMMIAPSIQQLKCNVWLRKHLPSDGSVVISDVTSMYTAICLMGPKARNVLSELTDVDLSTKAFPFFSFKELDVGLANGIRAMNLTHTGELGWVLYIPNEYALHVYNNLVNAGRKWGMTHAGYYAMRALRIEKFYAFWGQDLDSSTTPLECGRGFRVKFNKDIDFIGRSALEQQKASGIRRLYVHLLLDDHNPEVDPWAWGGEPIYRNNKFVGRITTTAFGYTLNNLVCLGFVLNFDSAGNKELVSPEYIMDGDYEVDIAGIRYSASVSLRSPSLPTKFAEPQMGRYQATQII